MCNVNLEVAEDEFVTLVGPSGCGKSTLLRIIAGLGEASSGTVEVAGSSTTKGNDKRSPGFVFQDANLLP